MSDDQLYEVLDALDALNEKCLEGYAVSLKYDPKLNAFWLKWAPPLAATDTWSGRGLQGKEQAFTSDAIIRLVRDFVRDAQRIRSLDNFRQRHAPEI